MLGEIVDLDCLRIHRIENGIFKENCYIVENIDTKKSIIIDPGSDGEFIDTYLIERNLSLENIFLTHGHFDHIGAVDYLAEKYHLTGQVSSLEKKLIRQASIYAFRIASQKLSPPKKICYFDDSAEIKWSGGTIVPLGTPGHTAGSVSYIFMGMAIFTGDTLFKSFIGPSIYTESNKIQLINSVSHILRSISSECIIFPGHGPLWVGGDAKLWWAQNKEMPPQFRIFEK